MARVLVRVSSDTAHRRPGAEVVLVRALRTSTEGRLGDEVLDRFLMEHLETVDRGPILHTECGDGSLVRRFRALGLDAVGADPGMQRARSGVFTCRGPLVALARTKKSLLGGVILSGVTDRVTPSSAKALVRLVATRLKEGGTIVLLSASPVRRNESDPVTTDLAAGRSLHPTTWCHLLARIGLEQVTVREAADGSAFAVAATRRALVS
ncbi:MAG: hypothetical protein ACYCSF_01985 [Acidimicrobiales bacterium]